ncbi:MAG TPA: alpha/beta hydrolase [Nitrososphaera sp.]
MQSELTELALQLIGRKNKVSFRPTQLAAGEMAEEDDDEGTEPSRRMHMKFHITTQEMNEQTVWSVAPKKKATGKQIYYLHGGTYVDGFTNQHWYFVANLVERLRCTVTAPDYPLALDHDVHDALEMVIPLYRELVETADASNLTLMGDSAGGGMSLALAQWLRNEDIKQPSNLFLLSPWLDVTMTNPDISRVVKIDDSSSEIQELRQRGKMYAGKTDPTNYIVSPIYGSLDHLAPITLLVGMNDVFVADCRKLKAKADAEGIALDYREFEGSTDS